MHYCLLLYQSEEKNNPPHCQVNPYYFLDRVRSMIYYLDHGMNSFFLLNIFICKNLITCLFILQGLLVDAEDYSAQYIDTVISMNAHSIIRSLVLRISGKVLPKRGFFSWFSQYHAPFNQMCIHFYHCINVESIIVPSIAK